MNTSNGPRVGKHFVLAALLMFLGCSSPKPPEEITVRHVDLPGYFRSEITDLKATRTSLQKTVSLSGPAESLLIHDPDWESELQLFLTTDLNKPGLSVWVHVDTIKSEAGTGLKYTSRDKASRLQHCYIGMRGEKIDSVALMLGSASLYGREGQQLTYRSGVGYSLYITGDPAVGKGTVIRITGSFVKE